MATAIIKHSSVKCIERQLSVNYQFEEIYQYISTQEIFSSYQWKTVSGSQYPAMQDREIIVRFPNIETLLYNANIRSISLSVPIKVTALNLYGGNAKVRAEVAENKLTDNARTDWLNPKTQYDFNITNIASTGNYTLTTTWTTNWIIRSMLENRLFLRIDNTVNNSGNQIYSRCALNGDVVLTAELDVKTPTCEVLSPKGVTLVADDENTFEWKYTLAWMDPNVVQTHYDLQYSYNNGATWQDYAVKAESSETQTRIPPYTFDAGALAWRVRVYLYSDVLGEFSSSWSEPAQVVVKYNAQNVIISADNMPRPTVSWLNAPAQKGFQIRVGDRKSPAVFDSSLKAYKARKYFNDGEHEVAVRVIDSTGKWGEWATTTTIIKNIPGEAITLTATSVGESIMLKWNTVGNYIKYYIYRDNVCIGKTDESSFTDSMAVHEHEYIVRGVLESDYYTMSNVAKDILKLTTAVLIPMNDTSNKIRLKYTKDNPATYSSDISQDSTLLFYSGRKKPLIVSNGQITRQMKLSYVFKTRSEADSLIALLGQKVFYRSPKGDSIVGIIGDFSLNSGKRYSLSFVITECDYEEEVDYDY